MTVLGLRKEGLIKNKGFFSVSANWCTSLNQSWAIGSGGSIILNMLGNVRGANGYTPAPYGGKDLSVKIWKGAVNSVGEIVIRINGIETAMKASFTSAQNQIFSSPANTEITFNQDDEISILTRVTSGVALSGTTWKPFVVYAFNVGSATP